MWIENFTGYFKSKLVTCQKGGATLLSDNTVLDAVSTAIEAFNTKQDFYEISLHAEQKVVESPIYGMSEKKWRIFIAYPNVHTESGYKSRPGGLYMRIGPITHDGVFKGEYALSFTVISDKELKEAQHAIDVMSASEYERHQKSLQQ